MPDVDDVTMSTCLALISLCTGTVLHITGTATPGWSMLHGANNSTLLGFWILCDNFMCQSLPEQFYSVYVQVCSVLAILGFVFSFLALVMAGLRMRSKQSRCLFTSLAAGSCFMAAVFVSVCLLVWGLFVQEKLKPEGYTLGYSFILSIAGGCLIGISGVFLAAGGRMCSRAA
ncbi:uncharacterized protein LOC131932814 [Physella acuta]|uniref:uncharacterized protein LOC131932814 n=1 Tax=Physella acuta TaxID=109671 RepID=UPI0027DBE385|nr:uncharacterized protein LOC131932814 [Physella acuta]